MSVPAATKIWPWVSFLLGVWLTPHARAADWPMWRHDAQRTASTPHALPDELYLHWVRDLPALRPAWPDQLKMRLDAAYEPVILGDTLFLGSSRDDSLTALDVKTGAEKWRFDTDGPIRYAPLAWDGRVFVTSDDGYLYCLDAQSGTLVWRFRGGPADRKVLGNERLISTWPARGAPVLADGTIYFAAGIWPFMGIFLHALDARTGTVIWTNDGDGSIYIKQPHNADAFAGVAPQGPLVVSGETLLVPGGRSVPALYDRKTGKLLRYQLADNGKRGGGPDVVAAGKVFLNGGAAFELATERYLGEFGRLNVVTDGTLYGWSRNVCHAYDLSSATITTTETTDRRGKKIQQAKWAIPETGSCVLPGATALMRAGARLYAGVPERVVALAPPTSKEETARAVWSAPLAGTPLSLAAAADRLFVSTREGRLYCFGPGNVEATVHSGQPIPVAPGPAEAGRASSFLKAANVRAGYGVIWGRADAGLLAELARQSELRLIAIDPDAARVRNARAQLAAAGLYGVRVAVHVGTLDTFPLPPYLASLMIVLDGPIKVESVPRLYESLRPFGGVALVTLPPTSRPETLRRLASLGLPQLKIRPAAPGAALVREGPLPGSANWTHEHADAANTRVSRDTLVKAPLGLLWFGGPSHDAILPRHGHGPQPQVIEGRLLIEGVDALRAVDIYTGRLLWEVRVPGLGSFYNNLAHQPGANAAGTNFISTADSLYVVHGKRCLRLDPATGARLAEFTLPPLPGRKDPPLWGYVNVVGDWLIGGSDPLLEAQLFKPVLVGGDDPTPATTPKATSTAESLLSLLKTSRMDNDNYSSSKHLVVLDRHSGAVRWSASARLGFRHNAICAGGGRLYAIDRHSGPELARLKRRGQAPQGKARLVVFDLETGRELWQTEDDVFGTWLSYSTKHDVVVEAGRVARDTLSDEPKGMRAYRAGSGQVLWRQPTYVGPAMIHGDLILKDRSACELLTGAPKLRRDPLTGEEQEWTWLRNYGCNTPLASEHLLTFRSGAAGYFDLAQDGGTGNLGGFRSGCTNNLIVAGGVLVAPDYTRTCTCNYQNQTSLALVHTPDAEMWTFFGKRTVKAPVRRVGINLGAPGNRQATDGTLWLEYPQTGGPSPTVPVQVSPAQPEWFRRHAAQVNGAGWPWVAASGGKGIETVTITLNAATTAVRPYTVRLLFAEPEAVRPGQRVFSVTLQGREVLKELDVVREAGASLRGIVKEFKDVRVGRDLTIRLTPARNASEPPLLCGVEVLAEGW